MTHSESLGKVVGNDGKTYTPSVVDNKNGSFKFTFKTENDNDTKTSNDIIIPYIIPVIKEKKNDNNEIIDKYITFEVRNDLQSLNKLPTIPYSDLKGDTGTSQINMEAITDVEAFARNLENAKLNTIYFIIYDDEKNDNIDTKVDAYIVYEGPDSNRHLEQINSISFLNNYYTKDYIDEHERIIQQRITDELNGVTDQQRAIINTLTNNINIDVSSGTTNGNAINVLSDTAVEDIKKDIIRTIEENFIEFTDIQWDETTGRIIYINEDHNIN